MPKASFLWRKAKHGAAPCRVICKATYRTAYSAISMRAVSMNPFLAKMGYGPSDNVLITHVEDVGVSHAANVAGFECSMLAPPVVAHS